MVISYFKGVLPHKAFKIRYITYDYFDRHRITKIRLIPDINPIELAA